MVMRAKNEAWLRHTPNTNTHAEKQAGRGLTGDLLKASTTASAVADKPGVCAQQHQDEQVITITM